MAKKRSTKRSTAQQNKRDLAASEQRQAEIIRLYLSGAKIADIAKEVGISERTVMRDINRAREQWKEHAARNYDELLPEKLMQLEEIRHAAWQGWVDSRKDFSETTVSDKGIATKTRGQAGNAAFLGQLEKILRLECQLRGMLKDESESTNVPTIVEVVIKSREEHEEFKTLNLEQYRKSVA